MANLLPAPRTWSDSELQEKRREAEALFVERRKDEGPRASLRTHALLRPKIEAVFAATNDLRDLNGALFVDDPAAWQACRYLCAPPISQEDLWTMVGDSKFKSVPARLADDVAEAIRVVLDPVRFPWVNEGRNPSVTERELGILSSTVLWSSQQVGTDRRGESSARQEGATAHALEAAGLTLDESRAQITMLDQMLRGTFARERRIANAKCDVPVRLYDGRLLALECKVSNGPKNGWKRVNREVGGKSETWKLQFGTQVITGVVLAGVFDLSCLRSAQEAGVYLFWEHDMDSLTEFVASST